MTKEEQEELKNEIQHIFDSGANEIRIFEMVKMFIDNRSVVNNLPIDSVSDCVIPNTYMDSDICMKCGKTINEHCR